MPSAWVSFATIARVNEADSAEIASSSRGTKAASLTSSWSGSGRPEIYASRKTRNVSFAASVTRFRTARSEPDHDRSEEHTSELQSRPHLVCRLLLEKKKNTHKAT